VEPRCTPFGFRRSFQRGFWCESNAAPPGLPGTRNARQGRSLNCERPAFRVTGRDARGPDLLPATPTAKCRRCPAQPVQPWVKTPLRRPLAASRWPSLQAGQPCVPFRRRYSLGRSWRGEPTQRRMPRSPSFTACAVTGGPAARSAGRAAGPCYETVKLICRASTSIWSPLCVSTIRRLPPSSVWY